MANATLHYLYCDAANWKRFGTLVLANPAGDGLDLATARQRLEAACDSGEFFIAEQAGVPPVADYATGAGVAAEHDHCYHTLDATAGILTPTAAPPGAVVTLRTLVEMFEGCRQAGWRCFDPAARYGGRR